MTYKRIKFFDSTNPAKIKKKRKSTLTTPEKKHRRNVAIINRSGKVHLNKHSIKKLNILNSPEFEKIEAEVEPEYGLDLEDTNFPNEGEWINLSSDEDDLASDQDNEKLDQEDSPRKQISSEKNNIFWEKYSEAMLNGVINYRYGFELKNICNSCQEAGQSELYNCRNCQKFNLCLNCYNVKIPLNFLD
jgi:hypothetical protein